jgi:tRNA threonylcarbamoyladenosine biosynthesis protein TsaE
MADVDVHPAPILETRSVSWPDESACAAFAVRVASSPRLWPSTFIALDGALGAGKTTFVGHLLRALGVQGRIKSPTFAVMEPYTVSAHDAAHAVSHFDFYRFDDAREWADAGFRDVFAAPGLKLAEWPERAAAVLPTADWWLHIDTAGNDRRDVTVHAMTPHGVALLP